MKINIVFDVIP